MRGTSRAQRLGICPHLPITVPVPRPTTAAAQEPAAAGGERLCPATPLMGRPEAAAGSAVPPPAPGWIRGLPHAAELLRLAPAPAAPLTVAAVQRAGRALLHLRGTVPEEPLCLALPPGPAAAAADKAQPPAPGRSWAAGSSQLRIAARRRPSSRRSAMAALHTRL